MATLADVRQTPWGTPPGTIDNELPPIGKIMPPQENAPAPPPNVAPQQEELPPIPEGFRLVAPQQEELPPIPEGFRLVAPQQEITKFKTIEPVSNPTITAPPPDLSITGGIRRELGGVAANVAGMLRGTALLGVQVADAVRRTFGEKPGQEKSVLQLMKEDLAQPTKLEQWSANETEQVANALASSGIGADVAYRIAHGVGQTFASTALTLGAAGIGGKAGEGAKAATTLWQTVKAGLPQAGKFAGLVYATTPGDQKERAANAAHAFALASSGSLATVIPTTAGKIAAGIALNAGMNFKGYNEAWQEAERLSAENGRSVDQNFWTVAPPQMLLDIAFGVLPPVFHKQQQRLQKELAKEIQQPTTEQSLTPRQQQEAIAKMTGLPVSEEIVNPEATGRPTVLEPPPEPPVSKPSPITEFIDKSALPKNPKPQVPTTYTEDTPIETLRNDLLDFGLPDKQLASKEMTKEKMLTLLNDSQALRTAIEEGRKFLTEAELKARRVYSTEMLPEDTPIAPESEGMGATTEGQTAIGQPETHTVKGEVIQKPEGEPQTKIKQVPSDYFKGIGELKPRPKETVIPKTLEQITEEANIRQREMLDTEQNVKDILIEARKLSPDKLSDGLKQMAEIVGIPYEGTPREMASKLANRVVEQRAEAAREDVKKYGLENEIDFFLKDLENANMEATLGQTGKRVVGNTMNDFVEGRDKKVITSSAYPKRPGLDQNFNQDAITALRKWKEGKKLTGNQMTLVEDAITYSKNKISEEMGRDIEPIITEPTLPVQPEQPTPKPEAQAITEKPKAEPAIQSKVPGELFPIKPSVREKNIGETEEPQIPQEELLNELKTAKEASSKEKTQGKLKLEAEPTPSQEARPGMKVNIVGQANRQAEIETVNPHDLNIDDPGTFTVKLKGIGGDFVFGKDVKPARQQEAKPESKKRDLDAELKAKGMEPSVFRNMDEKKAALKRAQALQGPGAAAAEGEGEFSNLEGAYVNKTTKAEPEGEVAQINRKNLEIEAEQLGYPLPPALKSRSFEDAMTIARERIAKDPTAGQRTIDELRENPRAFKDDIEVALLEHEKITRKKEVDAAAQETITAKESGDQQRIEDSRKRWTEANNAFRDIYRVLEKGEDQPVTSTARALSMLRLKADENFHIVHMRMEAEAANDWKALTKEQEAEIQKIHDEHKRESEAYLKRIEELEAKLKAEDTDTEAADVMEDLHKKARDKTAGERGTGKEPDLEGDKEKALQKITDAVESGETPSIEELQDPIQKIALYFEQKNIDANKGKSTLTHEELVKSVHGVIKTILPDVTPKEIRDAISGYGQVRYPSKDAARTALRAHKSELQKLTPLETVQKNIAELKARGKKAELEATKHTGFQRDHQTRIAAELQKRLNNALKEQDKLMNELGIKSGDSAKRLKSALDAVKTRLTNQITDLNKAIAEQKKLTTTKKGVEYDKEAKALEAQRDAIKARYDEMFPPEPITDQERLNIAIKGAERSLTYWQDKVTAANKGVWDTKTPPKPLPPSERLSNLVKHRDAIKAEVARLKLLAFPKATPEEIALKTFKTRTESRIKELERRMTAKDFAPKPRKPLDISNDPQAMQAKVRLEETKIKYDHLKEQIRWNNLSKLEKSRELIGAAYDAVRNVRYSFDASALGRQGWLTLLTHPDVWAKSVVPSFQSASRRESARIAQSLREDMIQRSGIADVAKLALNKEDGTGNYTAAEDRYRLDLTKHIPFLGEAVTSSGRMYATALNLMRQGMLKTHLQHTRTGKQILAKEGKNLTPEETQFLRDLGQGVNIFTGRGELKHAEAWARIGGAPRFLKSAFDILSLKTLRASKTTEAKIVFAKEYVRLATVLGTIYTIASQFSDDIDWDTNSPNFGTIKIGKNHTINPFNYVKPELVFISRMFNDTKATGIYLVTGTPRKENKPFSADTLRTIAKFAQSKAHPALGAGLSVITGKQFSNEPTTKTSVLTDIGVPLSPMQVPEMMKNEDIATGSILSILNLLGAPVAKQFKKTEKNPKGIFE